MLSEELRQRRRELVARGRSLAEVLDGILGVVSEGALPEEVRRVVRASRDSVERALGRL